LIKIYKCTDKNLFNRLKDCILSGYPMLIEGIEEVIDSSLEPVLQKNIFKQGGSYQIK